MIQATVETKVVDMEEKSAVNKADTRMRVVRVATVVRVVSREVMRMRAANNREAMEVERAVNNREDMEVVKVVNKRAAMETRVVTAGECYHFKLNNTHELTKVRYGGGGNGGDDEDLQGAARHAQEHSGGTGDSSMFSSILGSLSGNKQHLANQEVDEQGKLPHLISSQSSN